MRIECIFSSAGCNTCVEGELIIIDSDGDGVCDSEEIIGCQDEVACNYDSSATDSKVNVNMPMSIMIVIIIV